MDSEIRAMVDTTFVEECALYNLNDLKDKKKEIMDSVRKRIIPYFKKRGVTITTLGLKGDFLYDPKIQESIDKTFTAKKELEAQEIINKKKLEEATIENKIKTETAAAEAKAAKLLINSGGLEYKLKMERLRVQEHLSRSGTARCQRYREENRL